MPDKILIPEPNSVYRHYKGNLYKVLHIAMHTETHQSLVIYSKLDQDNGPVFARPLAMFVGKNYTGEKRFVLQPKLS